MSDNKPQSLYEYIKAAAAPFLEANKAMDFSLQSESKSESFTVPFADGAYDGIAMYHMGMSELSDETKELMIKAVQTASSGDAAAAEKAFIELGKAERAIRLIDALQDHIIANRETIPARELFEFAVYAITKSWDTECVKFGLSILELLNIEDNMELRDVIITLGLSEEFTLFAVFVMLRWQDGNNLIAFLARMTHGWGRIHAIERLEADTDEIRRWLLREGVHNTVMPSYSALTCWNKSGAAELLFGDEELSDEDLRGIRDIIDALLDEGPCSGISEVENAENALLEFLKKASVRELCIDDYESVRNIRGCNEENENITALCDEILNSEKCREIVRSAVREGKSVELAGALGIDCREDVLRLLESDFDDKAHLCRFLTGDGECRARAIEIFREKLPLGSMKKAPSNDLCFGSDFKNEHNLVYLIQELRPYPLEGADLVEASLQCAPPQNRNMALRVLGEWTRSSNRPLGELLPEVFELLKKLLETEPNDSARKAMEKLINGEIEE